MLLLENVIGTVHIDSNRKFMMKRGKNWH